MDDLDLQQLNEYITWMKEHGRRYSTVRNRMTNVRMSLRILHDAGRPTRAEDITPEDLIYLEHTYGTKESTRKTYLDNLSQFIKHFTDKDVLKKAGILRNRPEDSVDRVFITKDEFYQLYDMADAPMRMALVLGAFMGLRRMEIAAVRESDIEDGRIAVHGKGHGPDGLTVVMEIPRPVLDELRRFKEYRRVVGKDTGDDHLLQFMDHNGKWHGCLPETIGAKMKELSDASGIRVTTHSLRRLYATTLYNDCNVDMETLRRMMRHANVNTTLRCYVYADPSKMSDAVDALSQAMAL